MQLRGCPSHPVLPKNRTKKKKRTGLHATLTKQRLRWLFPEEKSIRDRRFSSTQILVGKGQGRGKGRFPRGWAPHTTYWESEELSFLLTWKGKLLAPSWALAPLCSPHCEMTEYSSCTRDLFHPPKPLISQVHAYPSPGSGRGVKREVSHSLPFTLRRKRDPLGANQCRPECPFLLGESTPTPGSP